MSNRLSTSQWIRSFSSHGKVNFDDTASAFKSKSLADLLLAKVVFRICTIPAVVNNAEALLRASLKIFGSTITYGVIKSTFFSHFCAGENEIEIGPRVEYLRQYGVGGIMDYAAEADVPEVADETPAPGKHSDTAKKHAYDDEKGCDANMQIFLDCIQSVHNVAPDGFAAIKITALGRPATLQRFSTFTNELSNLYFNEFAKDSDDGKVVSREQFCNVYRELFLDQPQDALDALFDSVDLDADGIIDFTEWREAVTMENMGLLDTSRCVEEGPLSRATLTSEEIIEVRNMMHRVRTVIELAVKLRVRVMIDAEQTYFQPAIDNIVLHMQKLYNKEFPTVFHTYQCYLKDAFPKLKYDLHRAKQGDYYFAAKIVRGAYMHSERRRADEMGYPSPIQDTLQDTHDNYHRAMSAVLSAMAEGRHVNLMVASHNQVSMETALKIMEEKGIKPGTGVYFGQLLGMADHLTFSLGQAGHFAYKYVPYGPVNEVMPYLLRRLQENSDMLGGVGKEIKMVNAELLRRITGR